MIPYMVGSLALNSTYFTRGAVRSVSRRGLFRTVPPKLGDKFRASPLRPSHSLNDLGPVVKVVHALSNPLNYISIYYVLDISLAKLCAMWQSKRCFY